MDDTPVLGAYHESECTCHQEKNTLVLCPACGQMRFFLRDPRLLDTGSVIGYDFMCGYALTISAPEKGPTDPHVAPLKE